MSLNYECGGTIKCYKNYFKAKIYIECNDIIPTQENLDFELHHKIILRLLDEMCLADDNRNDWEPNIELGEWAHKIMTKCQTIKKISLEDTRTGRFVRVVRD